MSVQKVKDSTEALSFTERVKALEEKHKEARKKLKEQQKEDREKLEAIFKNEQQKRAVDFSNAVWKLYEDGVLKDEAVKTLCKDHLKGYWIEKTKSEEQNDA